MSPVSGREWIEVAQRSLVAYSERTGTPVEDIDLPTALSSSELEVVQNQPGVVLEAQLELLYDKTTQAKQAFVRGVRALGITAGSLAGRAFALKLPQEAVQTLGAWLNVESETSHSAPKLSADEIKKLIDEVASLNTPERPDIPEGIPFDALFSFENKDVIYGRTNYRMDYIGRLVDLSWVGLDFLDEHWMTIDQYNNASMLRLKKFETPERILGDIDELVKDHPRVKTYWDELKNHPRFSPVTVLSTEEPKLEREGGADLAKLSLIGFLQPGHYNQHMLAIRRACKFGVDYIVNFTEGRVHFALDGVKDEEIVHKESIRVSEGMPEHFPITATELRSIYRNWDKVKHRVLFYRDGKTVKPPWESEPALWETYKRHREDKYEQSADAAYSALIIKVNELQEEGTVQEEVLTECLFHLMSRVDELINRGRFQDAISLMNKSAEMIQQLEDSGDSIAG